MKRSRNRLGRVRPRHLLEPLPGGRTHLRLAHHGFRHGGAWDEAYPYFTNAWARVVARLVATLR